MRLNYNARVNILQPRGHECRPIAILGILRIILAMIMSILPYIQIVLSVALVGAILMQQSEAGIGAMFGGSDSFGHRTRRGFEKVLFNATILLAALFVLAALANVAL